MKPLIPILVVATTSLAVASVQFAQQASDQRKRADTEVQLRQKQEARVAELERNQARLERELAMAQSQPAVQPAPTPPARTAMAPPRSASGRAPGVATFGVLPAEAAPPPGVLQARARGPMDTPAGRNFMRSRIKSSLRRLYGDAGREMGLSADKSNQLLDLLADQQTRNIGGMREGIPDGMSPQQYFEQQQKKNQDEISTLIGAEKMDQWTAYQKSLPQRQELGMVREQLEQAGYPMTDNQRTEMLAAITEEQQRLPRPAFTPGVPPEEVMTQMNQWQTDYNKALMDRAKQVLTSDQFTAYKEYQDFQAEMRNNIPRIAPGAVIQSYSGGGMVTNGLVPAPGASVTFSAAAPGVLVAPAVPTTPPQTQRK
jgi:hypothetical protein